MDPWEREESFLRLNRLTRGLRQYTDTSNAERFLNKHQENVRYCAVRKRWLCWDGVRWQADTAGKTHAMAKEIIRVRSDGVLAAVRAGGSLA